MSNISAARNAAKPANKEAAAKAEADRQVSEQVGAISDAVRNSGQATGTVELGQPPADDTLPDGADEGADGQNIAPIKKRGAYRGDVGGANSIRI